MGRIKKYATEEERQEALKQQRKNYIEKMGIDNYKEMVRKSSLICYHRNKCKEYPEDIKHKMKLEYNEKRKIIQRNYREKNREHINETRRLLNAKKKLLLQ